MSGWQSFVDSTIKPLYNGVNSIEHEIVDDVSGVYKWGKDTVSSVGNLAKHTVDNVTDTEDALAKALKAMSDIFSTPWLLYGSVAVVGVVLLTSKK
jgi:hypothetical protein